MVELIMVIAGNIFWSLIRQANVRMEIQQLLNVSAILKNSVLGNKS